ncbi:MAG: T9SS type A sorting domain-containing protein [Bacteroidetes bacterium]|nr:T9SS type A sorting domain-containing protein [Bacteroidota bacterium]
MKTQFHILAICSAFALFMPASAQWIKVTPNTGNVTCLYAGSNGIYAGLNKPLHYLFRSTDTGKTWTQLPVTPSSINSICEMDGCLFVNDATSDRVYYSLDKGQQWSYGTMAGVTKVFSVTPVNHTLVSATDAGLFRSIDSGKNWSLSENSGTFREVITTGNRILAAGVSGIKYSTDNGLNWTKTHTDAAYSIYADGRFVYAANNTVALGVVVSTDSGNTWKQYSAGLPSNNGPRGFTKMGDTLYCVIYDEVFKSFDTGKSWKSMGRIGFTYNASDIESYAGKLFVSYNSADLYGGIYQWTEGSRWHHAGLPIIKPERMVTYGDTVGFLYPGLVWSADRGMKWNTGGTGPGTQSGFKKIENVPYLFGSSGVYISANGGQNFTQLYNINTYDIEKLGNTTFLTSTNTTWKRSAGGSLNPIPALGGVYLGKMLTHNGRIFIANRSFSDDSYYSEDTGKTFKVLQDSLFKNLIFTGNIGNDLYALNFEKGNINSVIKSTDDGFTWKRKNKGLPQLYANNLLIWKGKLLLVSNKGLHVSDDGGESWQEANAGIPFNPPNISDICGDDSFLYVSSPSFGIYRGNFSNGVSKRIEENSTLKNIRVYPNPGNRVFYISGFNTPLEFTIFDTKGRPIPATTKRMENVYAIQLEYASPGIYILQITENNFRKFVQIVQE